MYMWSFMGGGSGWKGGEGRGERVQVGRAGWVGWAGLHHSPPTVRLGYCTLRLLPTSIA